MLSYLEYIILYYCDVRRYIGYELGLNCDKCALYETNDINVLERELYLVHKKYTSYYTLKTNKYYNVYIKLLQDNLIIDTSNAIGLSYVTKYYSLALIHHNNSIINIMLSIFHSKFNIIYILILLYLFILYLKYKIIMYMIIIYHHVIILYYYFCDRNTYNKIYMCEEDVKEDEIELIEIDYTSSNYQIKSIIESE